MPDVDAVAEAISEAAYKDGAHRWSDCNEEMRGFYRRMAQAAIDAMDHPPAGQYTARS